MQARPTARGVSLGQALGLCAVSLVIFMGGAFALKIHFLQSQAIAGRAETHLDQGVALLQGKLDAFFLPVQNSAALLRDMLVDQARFQDAETILEDLGPALLRQIPAAVALVAVHENGQGWEVRRKDGVLWARQWASASAPFADPEPAWRPVYGTPAEGDPGPDPAMTGDWRNHPAYRGAVSASRERGDGNRRGPPRMYWSQPRETESTLYMTQGTAFRAESGKLTALIEVDLAPIHRWTSRRYDKEDSQYLVTTAEGHLIGAPARFHRFLETDIDAVRPSLDDLSAHPAVEALHHWRTQSPAPTAVFSRRSEDGTWLHVFRRLELAPARALHIGISVERNAFGSPEALLLYWTGILTLAGAGLAILGSIWLAWRIRRPVEALIIEGSRVDALEVKRAFWPKTRINELQRLYHMFGNLKTQVNDLLKEAAAAREEESAPAEARTERPPLKPPEAFLQAMASARRELRGMKVSLRNQRKEQRAREKVWHELTGRIEAQRNALTVLHAEARRHGNEPLAVRLAGVAFRYTGVDGVSVWTAPEPHAPFRRVAAEGPGVPTETPEPLPYDTVRELLAQHGDHPVLLLRNAFNDVRSAACAAQLTAAEAPGLLIGDFPADDDPLGMLLFHRADTGAWEHDWQVFMLGLAGLLARDAAPTDLGWRGAGGIDEDTGAAFFQSTAEQAPGILLVLDERGHVRFANLLAEQFYGHPLVGRPWIDFAVNGEQESIEAEMARQRMGSPTAPFHAQQRREDGKYAALWVSMAPLQDEYGDVSGLVVWALEAIS